MSLDRSAKTKVTYITAAWHHVLDSLLMAHGRLQVSVCTCPVRGEHYDDDSPNLEIVAPASIYVVIRGQRTYLDITSIPVSLGFRV
jgi:hypothetical protein